MAFDPNEARDDHGRWTSGEAEKQFRTVSKGTDSKVNSAIVSQSGVKLVYPEVWMKDDAEQALAHVIADSKENTKLLQGMTVRFTDNLQGRHGTQKAKELLISSKSLKEEGPGFAATIIRHELEHKRLSDQGVSTGQQENRVRHTAGTWATIRYSSLAKTNPRAGAGFLKAAREQGIKV